MTADYHDLLGIPYRVGARGPKEYDCAGVVLAWMARAGVNGVALEPGLWERLGSAITDARQIGDVAHTIRSDGKQSVAVLVGTSPHVWLTAQEGLGVVVVRSRSLVGELDAVYRWPA